MAVQLVRPDPASRRIDVEKIKRGRWQPRRDFDQSSLSELADSILEHDVIQPLVVRFDKCDGLYEIVVGERRWRAAQLAGIYDVPAIVRNDLSLEQAFEFSLVENLQRDDLSPIEEAHALRRLIDEFSLMHKEVAARIGRSRSHVSNLVRLTELSDAVQDLLHRRLLDVAHAKPLLVLPLRYQAQLARMAARRGWSVKTLTSRVDDLKSILSGASSAGSSPDPNISRVERLVVEKLCVPCEITFSASEAKGTFILSYHSLDELQMILEALDIDT